MNAGARNELNSISRELGSIISELESISTELKGNTKGVGEDKCAACIDTVVARYREAKRRLDTMDTNTVTDSFAKAHPEIAGNGNGGGGGGAW